MLASKIARRTHLVERQSTASAGHAWMQGEGGTSSTRGVTVVRMSVVQPQAGCPGVLVESVPGVGNCERGDACEVLALKPDYISYRNAHTRITQARDD
jgi:hypothetical protein